MAKKLSTRLTNGLRLNYYENDLWIGQEIAKGNYEPFETKLFLKNIKPGDFVVDIGANIGFHTLLAATKTGRKGLVLAFEPDPKNFKLLVENAKFNHLENVILINKAVAQVTKEEKLFLSTENPGDHRLYADKNEAREAITIKTITLDEAINKNERLKDLKIAVIKIDTQGYEPFVLAGAHPMIERDLPTIFMEYWPYGYKRSKGNIAEQLDFLLSNYGQMFWIKDAQRQVKKTTKQMLDDFCATGGVDSTYYCNILFRKPNLSDKLFQFFN